jgi:hypothetical protein
MSRTMDYNEASHHLRVTPELLKWYCRYSPKGDGRKLQQLVVGSFSQDELDAFDTYLRTAWPNKRAPTGVARELRIEACGKCGVCETPCDKLQAAHIRRRGFEVTFYYQHPSNLILLCGHCHDRYDDPALKGITLEVVQAAKERLVARNMAAIDRDVLFARALRDVVESAKASIREEVVSATRAQLTNPMLWSSAAAPLLNAVAHGLAGGGKPTPNFDPQQPAESLTVMSGSLQPSQQMTRALLHGYALEATGSAEEAPSEWELVEAPEEAPEEYECSICGNLLDSVDYGCNDCGHHGSSIEQPDTVEENAFGVMLPVYTDDRGDSYALTCEKCDGQNLTLSYFESMCSSCAHRFTDDDD